MDETAEQELRDLVAQRVAAVRAKDPGPLAARHVEHVVTFDVLPPLMSRGAAPVVAKTQQWFDGYASDIAYDVEELDVLADGELGFCSFVYHVRGTLTVGDEVDMWVRATLCCRKVDGDWRIVHDHESVPFDPQTGMAVIDLAPSKPDAR
jgi:ketosteroid isomerase-like protein